MNNSESNNSSEAQAETIESKPSSQSPEDIDVSKKSSTQTPTPQPKADESKPKFIKIGILILFFIVILIVGAYYVINSLQKELDKSEPIGPNVQRIIDSGKIVIAADATFPPMEYVDNNEKIIGYDIDLGNRISEELNVKAEFKNIVWDDIFDKLLQGDVDIVISSVTITDERKLKYNFSEPYLNAGQVIITRKATTSITSTDDLQGKKIAVQKGTTNEQQALEYTSEALVLKYDDFIDATNALLEGKADVIFSDLTGAKGIVNANPTLKIASDPFTSEFYGIVFRKDEEDLVVKINSILDTLRQRGVLVLLKQKWLE